MVLHGSPISREDPAVARKRARATAELNDERLPVPAKNADLLAASEQSEISRMQERHRSDDDRQLGSLQALKDENAMLRARLAASEEEKSRSLEKHKLEVDALRRELKDLRGSYSGALKWAYTAKTTPREHWLEKGHSAEHAGAMVKLQRRFMQTIKDLRTGTVGKRVDVRFILQDGEGNDITADHDDVLMPYWKELANAIRHWSEYHANDETLVFLIGLIETPDSVLDVLRPALKQSKVEYVGFHGDGTPKTWKLAKFIEDVVKTNLQVTRVSLAGIILSTEKWKTICNAFRMRNAEQASAMQYFGLWKCFVDGNTEVLKEILTSTTAAGDKGMRVRLRGNEMSHEKRQS